MKGLYEHEVIPAGDWTVCVQHTRQDLARTTWCGSPVRGFVFTSLDAAAYSILSGFRLQVCAACSTAAAAALAREVQPPADVPPRSYRDQVAMMLGEVEGQRYAWMWIHGKGCCEVGLFGETAGLRRLWVDDDCRRQGIGSALFGAVCDFAREAGAKQLEWSVRKGNAPAMGFYLKHDAIACAGDAEDWTFTLPLWPRH